MPGTEPASPIRVLHVCSILQEAPTLLPVPPVAGGAPCWNVFRLHEALCDLGEQPIYAEVMSACEPYQVPQLQSFPRRARYEWVLLPSWERRLSVAISRASRYSMAALRRILGTTTWLSYRYLRAVRRYWQTHSFDLMIVDDAPQNLQYVSRFVPREKLAFFFRGQIGMSRRYLNRCGLLITTNDNLARYIEEVLPPSGPRPRIAVVPNSLGAEFAQVTPKEQILSGPVKTIIFVGRFVPEKGVRELVRAFHIVHERFPDTRLRIVGSSSYDPAHTTRLSEYEQEVRELAKSLPNGVVSFAGFVPYEGIPQEYLAADIAVFPSLCVEGFGMVALEAMRCGLPVIVSNRPGFTSLVRDGVNGLVVDEPENPQVLAQAMSRLLSEPALARQIASNGLETAQGYTPAAAAEAFAETIRGYSRIAHP